TEIFVMSRGCRFQHVICKRKRTMKRALIGIVSTGIFAVSVGVESANAQTYGPYGYSRAHSSRDYVPQNRSAVRRGAPRNAPLYGNPDSPAASGGGSLGYNQSLELVREGVRASG